ncbi:MAG: prepilin-type N-terminal cleavage/methylation domain-containing protein [Nitrosomonadales bacterium]|nr:MAG: prepilin-type N-terminal cleavage/methylation domain-containing protein [Nitrosomonadales bacterium]
MKPNRIGGFTLIELMIAVVIVGILAAVALPSYREYIKKGARAAAQTELLQMAAVQEKIYLNSNAYTPNVTTAYNGTSTGGLGITSGTTTNSKYTITLTTATAPSQTYTLTATPVAGTTQAGDGNITISENGQRCWYVSGAAACTAW